MGVRAVSIDESSSNYVDKIKFLLMGFLFVAAFYGHYHYATFPLVYRLVGWLLILIGIVGIGSTTEKGRVLLAFLGESKNELRKVVWPTRQEAIQTAIAVIVMVLLTSVILWLIDAVCLLLVGSLVGHRIV